MAKKSKISIQRDASLEMVDEDLESAMNLLDGANQKVADLLSSYAAPPPSADAAGDAAIEQDNLTPSNEGETNPPSADA